MQKVVLLLVAFVVLFLGLGARFAVESILDGVPPPTKAIGMMFNYPPLEAGKVQGPPTFFVRSGGAVSRAGDPIVIPKAYAEVLYEGELVVVMGKRARKVTPAQAKEHILGYTCGMDGSPLVKDAAGERDVARSLAGKSADGIAPVGPAIIKELRPEGHWISLRVNGKEIERANTRDLIWDPARLVSEISQTVTLEPGDVIYAGARRALPRLTPGDIVEVEIDGIGTLRSPVQAER